MITINATRFSRFGFCATIVGIFAYSMVAHEIPHIYFIGIFLRTTFSVDTELLEIAIVSTDTANGGYSSHFRYRYKLCVNGPLPVLYRLYIRLRQR